MSALDITARALALRAAAAQKSKLYADLAQAHIPAAIVAVESSGHAREGLGGGTYLADALAGPALAAAHPAACFRTRDGRYFRLAGDLAGRITPEQLGCPEYSAGANQQAFIQAAVDYAIAVGLNGVILPQPVYELWAPRRTSAFTDNTAHDGNFLVVSGRLSLIGTHPLRAKLHCKGPTGGSLLTDYQVLDGPPYADFTEPGELIWRGAGIKITGEANSFSLPEAEADLAMVDLQRIILFSDAVGVQNLSWPSAPPSRIAGRENCWDVTNKGIYCQQDRQCGVLRATDVDVIGFLGECVYTSNAAESGFVGRNLVMKHSNGQALNPAGPGIFDVDGLYAENCGMTLEGWGGRRGGRIVNATFRNMKGGQIAGGHNRRADRREDGFIAFLDIDARMEDCRDLYVGPNVHGRLVLIDTQVAVVSTYSDQPIRNVDLDITSICDRRDGMNAIRVGPASGAPAQSISDVSIRLHMMRTQEARAAGRGFNLVLAQSGSLGQRIVLRLSGEARAIGTIYGAPLPDYHVSILDDGLQLTDRSGYAVFDARNGTAPELGMGLLRASFAGESGLFSIPEPGNVVKFSDGAEVVIEHREEYSRQAVLAVGSLALLAYGDRLKLRADRTHNRWRVVEAPRALSAIATVDVPATAAGAEAGPFVIARTGCRPDSDVRVRPAASLPGYAIASVRAETGAVRFWLRNVDGGDPAPAVQASFTVSVSAGG